MWSHPCWWQSGIWTPCPIWSNISQLLLTCWLYLRELNFQAGLGVCTSVGHFFHLQEGRVPTLQPEWFGAHERENSRVTVRSWLSWGYCLEFLIPAHQVQCSCAQDTVCKEQVLARGWNMIWRKAVLISTLMNGLPESSASACGCASRRARTGSWLESVCPIPCVQMSWRI